MLFSMRPEGRTTLGGLDIRCLLALRASRHIKSHTLIFLQGFETAALNRGEVREQIVAAIIRLNESETFSVVEPFYSTSCHRNLPKTKN